MSKLHRNRRKILGLSPKNEKAISTTYIRQKEYKPSSEFWFGEPLNSNDDYFEEQKKEEVEFEKWKKENQYPNFVPTNWKDCYKLPLHTFGGGYVWTADGGMALCGFDFREESMDDINHIVSIINGEVESDYEKKWSVSEESPVVVLYDGEFRFMVRGWGHLTGRGRALNLPPEIAKQMQDEFIEHIIKSLNGDKDI